MPNNTLNRSEAIWHFVYLLSFRGPRPVGFTLGFKKHDSRNSKGFVARIDGEGGS